MKKVKLFVLFAMLAAIGLVSQANAQVAFHGISFLKGAESPVEVNSPYQSAFIISNTVDTAHDTLHVTSLIDVVQAAAGDVNSGNILETLTWHFTGGAGFIGPSHMALPFGSTATCDLFSHYTVADGDFFLPSHVLVDTALISWHDTCDGNSTNCNTMNRNTDTVSQAEVTAPLPCVKVTKTVDCEIAPVGKVLNYTIKVENCGPNPLTKVSINDSLLGPLSGCDTLAVGASCTLTPTYTIDSNDPDPLGNTVDVNYVDGFGQYATSSDTVNVDLIHPAYTVTKVCDANSKPISGPFAFFDVTITNTGDVDLSFTTDEAALSDVAEPFTVAAGQSKSLLITKPSTCPESDVNNTINVSGNVTVDLECPIADINVTAPASSDAICYCQPTIDVNKVADCTVGTIGQEITYTITIKNTGGTALTLVDVNDSILGDLTATAQGNGCTTLAAGAQCSFTVNHTLTNSDADPLVNVVTVDYVDGQQVPVSDTATANVEIIHPDFTVTKTCTSDPIPSGGPATFDVVVTNVGDVNLSFTTNESSLSSLAEPFTVDKNGASTTFTITVPTSGAGDVTNSITVTAHLIGEPNCVQFCCPAKTAEDTCLGAGQATRTWGFWKEHTALTKCVFTQCGGSFNLGWRTVDSYGDLFGIFFANNAKNSNGTSRDALCKARVTASKQALAALLNNCLANGALLPEGLTPATIANTLKNGTAAQIMVLNGLLDAYNQSGDLFELSGESCNQGNATPAESKAAANISFANCQ